MSRYSRARPLLLAACALPALAGIGCKSTKSSSTPVRSYDWAKLDAELPSGSTATPSHRLPRFEYPFDARGNYITSWAAEGERRNGWSSYASTTSRRSSSASASSSYSKPNPKSSYRYHKVAAGDTLYGLSRRYSTSVSAIKKANGLRSDLIINGRTLKIP